MSKGLRRAFEDLREDLDIKDKADPAINPEENVEGTDLIESVSAALSAESLVVAIEEEIVDALDTSDRIDGMIDLHETVGQITNPTEAEVKLINIADSLTNDPYADEVPIAEVISQEGFADVASKIGDKIVSAFKSIGDSIGSIFDSFGAFLSKIGFSLKSYRSQITKLRSMITNIESKGYNRQINATVKADSYLWTGNNAGSKGIIAVTDGDNLTHEFVALCGKYDLFGQSLAVSVALHEKRYIEAFTALFSKGASLELFYQELRDFDKNFIQKISTDAGLDIIKGHGFTISHMSRVGLGGVYFEVTVPDSSIYKVSNVDTVLKSFDQFKFGPDSVDFDHKATGKTREIMISTDNINEMLNKLDDTLATLANLTNSQVRSSINRMKEFSEVHFSTPVYDEDGNETTESKVKRTSEYAKEIFKSTNSVARLQVMEARAIIDSYNNTYYGLTDLMSFMTRFCYDVVNNRGWYEQGIAEL